MRVIARKTLTRFVESLTGHKAQAAVKGALDAWFHEVQHAAGILSAERVVFNIKGNDYGLVTAIDFARQAVFIEWLGSHADYNKIDAKRVEYER